MKKSRNLFILILILSTIATALVIWRLFFFKPQPPIPILSPTPTPTSFLAITPSQEKGRSEPGLYEKIKEETETNFPLLNLLPHEEANWMLDYIGPLHLEATAKKGSAESIKLEVTNWIRTQGIDPQTHQIDWKPSP